MTEKNKGKKLLTWTLALSMTLALPPVGVFAEDGAGSEGSQQTNSALAAEQPDGSSNRSEASSNEGNESVSTPENGGQNTQTAPPSGTLGTPTPSGEGQNGKDETLTPLPTPVSGEKTEEGKGNTTTEGKDENKDETTGESVVLVPEGELDFNNGVIKGIKTTWLNANTGKSLKVVIPAEINGATVTSIGNQAFMSCEKLTSVDLSKTKVTAIGKLAFSYCTALQDVVLPDTLESLGSSVFTGCTSIRTLRTATAPEGVVFSLPDTLNSIGYQTFKNCFASDVDAKVIVPKGVETIADEAFKDKQITQIIVKRTVDPWKGQDYSSYDVGAFRPPNGCNRLIIFPDNKCFVAFTEIVHNLQCTYPIKIKFSPIGYTETHLNHALLGWELNAETHLWDYNKNYKLPDISGNSSTVAKPGYEYIGGWKLSSSLQILDETKKLEAKDNPSDTARIAGNYKLCEPEISYIVDGKKCSDDPLTVAIGDEKNHTVGVKVDHALLQSEQGTEDNEYVYFEYCWWDESGSNLIVNGPRSEAEPELFSTASSNVDLNRKYVTQNAIPIISADHARISHSYYLVEIFGYHVNGNEDPVLFYQSGHNFIGSGSGTATTNQCYVFQVKVNEVRVIEAICGENGSINPAGKVSVPKGGNQTFAITPDNGYHIADVLVDGKSVGAVKEYTFKDVTEGHTIAVTFAKDSSGGGGGGGHRPKPKPTVEIPDDDALGLNNTDHFAYVVGYENGEVQPQNSITRAEVAAIFFRLLEDGIRSENFTHQNDFSDVAADAWYCSSVSTLSRMGIIAGYPDGTFRPNAPITRAEFAAIATRFDNNGDKTPVSFTDIIGHWAEGEITVAANHGWVSGYGDDTFRPQNQITRAETMSLVNRVLKRLPETPADLLPDMITWTDNADTSSWYYLPVQEATNSHYYEFKENSKHEKWTELRETRDWSKLG
nr:S-layer homology domain-containing protein [uncultured Anaerotignum sp.]